VIPHPLNFDWKGILIDADLRASPRSDRTTGASGRSTLSGLRLDPENRIFEDDLSIASVSTAKALGLAPGQSVKYTT
jgi:hypothetical protein